MLKQGVLTSTFMELVDNLVDDFEVEELLNLLSDRCVEIFDISAAGLMLGDENGLLRLMASSNEEMRMLELFELQAEEGPCPDCYRTGEPVLNKKLVDADDLWPRFARRAVEAGFQSVHALPMRLRGRVIGALNLFRIDEGEMADDEVQIAQSLADIATIAMLHQRTISDAELAHDQLYRVLNDRTVIEQAIGVVAYVGGCDIDQASAHLRGFARRQHRQVVEVARDIVDRKLDPSSLVA